MPGASSAFSPARGQPRAPAPAGAILRGHGGGRRRNIETARKFGVKNPEAIVAAYLKAQERWRSLSKAIGRDVSRLRDALMREVYDKLDYASL